MIKSDLEIYQELEEKIIIRWRKAIREYFKKEWGDSFILTFLPEIEGEHD